MSLRRKKASEMRCISCDCKVYLWDVYDSKEFLLCAECAHFNIVVTSKRRKTSLHSYWRIAFSAPKTEKNSIKELCARRCVPWSTESTIDASPPSKRKNRNTTSEFTSPNAITNTSSLSETPRKRRKAHLAALSALTQTPDPATCPILNSSSSSSY